MMKRRRLLTQAAIASVSATTLSSCIRIRKASSVSDQSLPVVQWRMATSWPKSLTTIFGGAETVCQRVSEMTDSRFTITPYAAGEIVPGLQVLDAVQSGTVECGHSASYYYTGKNPALAFGTSVPFGLGSQQQNAWLYHGQGLAEMQKLYADFNAINFPAGNTGAQMGGWFKKDIQSLKDLQGLKMRIPGLGGKVMSRLGVNVQVLPGGEIYLALERGAIDAAEWVGPYDDQKLGLNRAAKYYFYPGWWEPGPTLDLMINRSDWQKLPMEYQEILRTAAQEANLNMLSQYDALNREAMGQLLAGGTQLVAYSQEILQAAQQASFELYEEISLENSSFKQIFEQWKQFRRQIFQWNAINVLSYEDFAWR